MQQGHLAQFQVPQVRPHVLDAVRVQLELIKAQLALLVTMQFAFLALQAITAPLDPPSKFSVLQETIAPLLMFSTSVESTRIALPRLQVKHPALPIRTVLQGPLSSHNV